jgi:peptidoglycan/LPS O-acetylase OafA/YrhL
LRVADISYYNPHTISQTNFVIDTPSVRPRLPALTSLRFFAALHVLLFHAYAMGAVFGPIWYQKLSAIGYIGVSFFFVLSGFILVYTYAGRPAKVSTFWRTRFARVYPAYALALLLTLPFFLFTAHHFGEIGLGFLAFEAAHIKLATALEILLLQAWIPAAALSWNAVGWSLSVEAFFYLVFPFALLRFQRLERKRLLFLIVVCALLSNAVSIGYTILRPDGVIHPGADVYTSWIGFVKFFPLMRLPEFLMGMACGLLFLKSPRNPRLGSALVVAGVLAIAAVALFASRLPYAVIHTALLSPAFAAIVYGVANRPSWTGILDNRGLVLLGNASYSFYLIHANIVFPFFHTSAGALRNASFTGLAMCLAIVLVISILIYRLIEEPARRRLRPKSSKPEALAASAAAS